VNNATQHESHRPTGALRGRAAIVTGASSGVGKAIAELYAEEGAHVVLVARSRASLETLAGDIVKAGGSALAMPADVTSETEIEAVIGETVRMFGSLDILVNNAGVTTRLPTDELPLETWKQVIDVNVTGVFICAKAALRVMKPQGRGRIINVGSVAAKAPRPDAVAYTTSKAALEGLTRSLAIDGRDHGVTASVLQPGNTQSALWRERGALAEREGIMSARDVARVAVLPDEINLFEAIVHPIRMPWIGRG
jgi:NAD(P)-dependent dehydrogenase (short-subunit alcohol dehydrogenase family)